MLTITILLLITEQRRRGEQAAKRDALVALKAQKVALSATYFNEALRALEDQQGDFVLAYLARSLQKDPENFSARGLLFNLLGTGLLKAGPAVQFDEEVFSVSFSPDGRRLLVVLGSSGARVAEAQVREATTGKLVGRPIRHGFGVKEATFSPDGKKILTIGYSESTYQHRTARVWDAATGEPIGEPMPSVQGSNVTFASFSPDSQRILTASSKLGEDDGTQVWNAVTGEAISQPMRHEGSFLEIKQARFSPDGRQVVTVTSRGLFQVWDAHTGARIGEPSDFSPNEICCVAFTEKGPRVMTVFRNSATMWDVTTHKELGTVVGDTILARADFSSDGQSVIATAENHTVSVWTDFQTTPPLRHADPINSAVLSPNNRWVLTASDDKTARLWDAQTGLPIGQPMRHEDSVNDAVFSPDGRIVATASSDRTVQLWTAVTGSATPTREDVKSADFSPNGLHIVTEWGGNDGTARVWDAATAKPIGQPMHLPQFFETVSFSPDGLRILTTSGDGTARLWEAATGKPIGQPMRHRGFLRSAAFSPDGLRLVTTADDKRDLTNKGCAVYLWDTAMQKQVGLPIRSESTCAYWASFSPDGRRIVISGIGAELRDAATGDLVGKRFNYDEENVASCDLSSCAGHGAVFSSDGSRILGPGSDHTVVVWDAASGTPLGKPIRLVNRVVSWSFSPDGKHIVTASEDHVARVWDSITDEPIGQPMRHQGIVGASFSPDGRRVLTISGRPGTFRIWDAATGRPMSPLMWLDGWDGKSATFSPDGRRVLTVGKGLQTGTAQLWDALIGVPEDAPLLSDLAEAVSGFALSDETGPVRIPDPYWRLERFKQNAAAIGKGSADLQSLAQWLFTDDRLRTLSALSKARD
jgi:WD40 repeat protein